MLDGSVTGLGSIDHILGRLRALGNPDVKPLAELIGGALIQGNRDGLLAGTDGMGRPLAPLSATTIQRWGSHSPLLPNGENSPLIAGFTVQVETTPDGARITAGWNGVPELPQLRTGTATMPARDPVGIRPATRTAIQGIVSDFAKILIGGTP